MIITHAYFVKGFIFYNGFTLLRKVVFSVEYKTFARSIKIFLIDGMPQGRMSVELSNWTGKAYKIPRTMVTKSGDRPDLEGTGAYLLFGKDPEDDSKDTVYIGETEEVFKRLKYHLDNKEYWNIAVVIISKDDNLNKAHLKYLESKMYNYALEAGRYKVENANKPKCSFISEPDVAEMEEFFINMALLISTLGFKVFDKVKQISTKAKDVDTFFIKTSTGTDAQGQQTEEGFVVLKGSKVAEKEVPSFKGPQFKGAFNLRKKLIDEEVITMEQGELILTKDYLFSSPSTAAMVVMGRSANGRAEWKTAGGVQLKDIERE